jgi:hypothetical protein
MRSTWIVAALCALPLVTLSAQDVSSTKDRIRREVEEKQRLMREGKVVRSNVRITVRLLNGSRIKGVVKNGKFVERHDGLAFIQSERATEGAGLRLWYYDQTDSYIFLPWSTVAEHSIGEVLSDEEVAQMGLELERAARTAREQPVPSLPGTQPPPPAPPGPAGGTPPPGTVGPVPAPGAGSALTPAQQALLAEFPPEAGWGEEKRKQLELRKIQVGVFPNVNEQRFLDNFAAWSEAEQLRRATEGEQGVTPGVTPGPIRPPQPGAGTPGSGPAPAGSGTPPKGPGKPPARR